MDIDVQNKFITAFQERMNFFIPRFEEQFEKRNLLKKGQKSQIYLYWHKVNNIYYVVKEINIKCIKDLEQIKSMIDCFFLVEKQICNKKNIVRSEGFYYKFNRSKNNINSHITSPSNSTIDFYFAQEKCDGSLEDLFNIFLTSSIKNNNINQIDTLKTSINLATSTDQRPPQIVSLAVPQSIRRPHSSNQSDQVAKQQYQSSSQPDIIQDHQEAIKNTQKRVSIKEDLKQNLQELDIFNLYNNLKDLILQIHEFDGCAIYVKSFELSDILYIYTNNQLDFKFSKITNTPCDSKEQMRLLAKSILKIGLLKQFNDVPELEEQIDYNQLNQLSQNKKQSQYNYQQLEYDQKQIKSDKNQYENNKQQYSQNECQQHGQQQQQLKQHYYHHQQQQQSQNPQSQINFNTNLNMNINSNQNNFIQNNQNSEVNKECCKIKQLNGINNNSVFCSTSSFQHLPNNQATQNQNNHLNPSQKYYHHNNSISLNNSPSSSVSKFQKQPALSNNISFKDLEQKILMSSNMQQYQCRNCQSTNSNNLNGHPRLNQQGSINQTKTISQDLCYNDNDLFKQKQQIQLLLENIKLLQKKYEQVDIVATVTKFCKLLENMVKGQTVNQCYYQMLKIYNASDLFYEFNQSKLSFINPQIVSQSKRQQSNAQLLFSPPRNVLRKSDSNYRARSQNNDESTLSSSPSQIRKRSSRGTTQESNNALASYIDSLKDNTLFTLIQTFSNLINAVKQKKKKLRFEKYLTYNFNQILNTIITKL